MYIEETRQENTTVLVFKLSDLTNIYMARRLVLSVIPDLACGLDDVCKLDTGGVTIILSVSIDCQIKSVPHNLLCLINLIMQVQILKVQIYKTGIPAALSTAQLIPFNSVKQRRAFAHYAASVRHSVMQYSLFTSLYIPYENKYNGNSWRRMVRTGGWWFGVGVGLAHPDAENYGSLDRRHWVGVYLYQAEPATIGTADSFYTQCIFCISPTSCLRKLQAGHGRYKTTLSEFKAWCKVKRVHNVNTG